MRRQILMLFAIFAVSVSLSAQTSGSTPQSDKPAAAQDSKDKKDKKDKKKKDAPDENGADSIFNDRAANDVLGQIRDGLEGHSVRTMLGAFSGDDMDGYLNFEDQVMAFFQKYDMFRVRFRISSATAEGSKGIAIVDADLECTPAGGHGAPVRRSGQLRFELERTKKGWKVVDVRNRSFFQ